MTVSNLLTTTLNFEKTQGETMKKRTLKVRQTHRDYYLEDRGHKGNPTTSLIQLKGTWLEEAGFTIDTPVSVTVQKNRLVLETKSSN